MMRLLDRLVFWLEKGGEWIARALIAVGAGFIAFSFVPFLVNTVEPATGRIGPSLVFVEILAGAFALYQLSGFLMPKVCRWCRVGLASALALALFTRWMSLPVQTLFGKLAMAFLVWNCFTLIIEVLEIPHADYLRDQLASTRSLRQVAPQG
jgi:hypothetical protein